jgi:hypothetical protein
MPAWVAGRAADAGVPAIKKLGDEAFVSMGEGAAMGREEL